jgi:alkylglycerol monooxygenase
MVDHVVIAILGYNRSKPMAHEISLVNIYSFITPLVVVLILAEMIYCFITKKDYIKFNDAITNLGTALGNQCVNLFVAFSVVGVFGWLYQYRFFTIPTTLTNFIILLVLFDFMFYWFHRHNHTINMLWAAHMPHHTSEEFNTFVATRASITQRLLSFTYMWPLVFLGFRPEAIYAASAVQLLIAFWHHTRTIGKMPGFELIFNSPSYHRVHHAMNDKYLDKNFGEIFIIWDKMFGTYMQEEEEPVYGALTPIESYNPNRIYFHYWSFLWEDCKATKNVWDKVRLWFMPLGWRPADRRTVFRKRVRAENLVKFDTHVSSSTKKYLVFQVLIGLGLMFLTINLKWPLEVWERVGLTGVLWIMITNWGGMLENKKWVYKSDFAFIVLLISSLAYLAQRFQLYHLNPYIVVLAAVMLPLHLSWRMKATSSVVLEA